MTWRSEAEQWREENSPLGGSCLAQQILQEFRCTDSQQNQGKWMERQDSLSPTQIQKKVIRLEQWWLCTRFMFSTAFLPKQKEPIWQYSRSWMMQSGLDLPGKYRALMVCTCTTVLSQSLTHHAPPFPCYCEGGRAVQTIHTFPNFSPTPCIVEVLTRPPSLPLCTYTAPKGEQDFLPLFKVAMVEKNWLHTAGITASNCCVSSKGDLTGYCPGPSLCLDVPRVSRTSVRGLPSIRCRRGLQAEGHGPGIVPGP